LPKLLPERKVKPLAKIGSLFVSCLLLSLFLTAAAQAHVVVLPSETTQGSYETFTMRVPTEKESPTVKIELKIPVDNVSISRVEPKPDWKYELSKDATGEITAITWTAAGNGLSGTEFGEFKLQGKVKDDAKPLVWKAYQTYGNGSVVEWTGAAGSETPASVTAVKTKTAGAEPASPGRQAPAAPEASPSAARTSALPLYLSSAALSLSVISLLVSLLRKAK
jgi:uncharacterized protein YcnI